MALRLTGRTWARVYGGLGVAIFLVSLLHMTVSHDQSSAYHKLIFGLLMVVLGVKHGEYRASQ